MNTKLINVNKLQSGMITIRNGNDGDIIETVISVRVEKFFTFYTVELGTKRYEMNSRNCKFIRVAA